MATVYSNVSTSSYNDIRLKVDYSGTSASVTVQFKRNGSAGSYGWNDSGSTVTFNGRTVAAPYSDPGYVSTSWINLVGPITGFTVAQNGGTYNWAFTKKYGSLAGSGTVTVPAQNTAPTGLAISNITPTRTGFTATVSVTGWGVGGTVDGRRLQLSVSSANGSVVNRRWVSVKPSDSSVLSARITVDNTSTYGNITISPNTTYYLTPYATNGAASTGDTSFTASKTLPPLYVKNNGKTKLPKGLYVKNNGKTDRVVKLYAKSNGKTKKIY